MTGEDHCRSSTTISMAEHTDKDHADEHGQARVSTPSYGRSSPQESGVLLLLVRSSSGSDDVPGRCLLTQSLVPNRRASLLAIYVDAGDEASSKFVGGVPPSVPTLAQFVRLTPICPPPPHCCSHSAATKAGTGLSIRGQCAQKARGQRTTVLRNWHCIHSR